MPAWASKSMQTRFAVAHVFGESLLLLFESCWFLAFHAGSGGALHAMKAAGFFLASSTLLWTEVLVFFFILSSCTTWLGWCRWCSRVEVVVLVCPLVVCTCVHVCVCMCVCDRTLVWRGDRPKHWRRTPPSPPIPKPPNPVPCCHPIYTYPLHRLLLAEVRRKAWCVLGSLGFPSRALKNPIHFLPSRLCKYAWGDEVEWPRHFTFCSGRHWLPRFSFASTICLATLTQAFANMHVPWYNAWLAFIHVFSLSAT